MTAVHPIGLKGQKGESGPAGPPGAITRVSSAGGGGNGAMGGHGGGGGYDIISPGPPGMTGTRKQRLYTWTLKYTVMVSICILTCRFWVKISLNKGETIFYRFQRRKRRARSARNKGKHYVRQIIYESDKGIFLDMPCLPLKPVSKI